MSEKELKAKIEDLEYQIAVLHFENISLKRELVKTHKICSFLILNRIL